MEAMRRIYLGGAENLREGKTYTNLSELWLDDPKKRRMMRQAGIDEPTVCGEKGDYALLCAYLTALQEDGAERNRAARTLYGAFGFEEAALSDPKALWEESAEALASGKVTLRGVLARAEALCIETAEQVWDTPRQTALSRPVMTLDAFVSWGTGIASAIASLEAAWGREIDGIDALVQCLRSRADVFASAGCDAMLLTVEARLPACLRAKTEDCDAWLKTAKSKDGRGLRDEQRDALAARILLGILPVLCEKGWLLILRAGAREWGDGRLPCGFDAFRFAEIAEKLGGQMPRVLLCPRSDRAKASMRSLLGVFPSILGKPAVSMTERDCALEGASPLCLLEAEAALEG